MPILPIRILPDPVLREQAKEVVDFDEELGSLLESMAETMYHASGIGLAANQVGILKRVAVVDTSENRDTVLELINPQILKSEGKVPSEEGCLSIPEYRETIKRAEKIMVRAQDRTGKEFELEADGLLAICIQHEVDHLNGVLFIDHMSRLKRELFKRWLKKRAPEGNSHAGKQD